MPSRKLSHFLPLLALLCGCGLEPEPRAGGRTQEPQAASQQLGEVARALKPYERFLGGVWRCVFSDGIAQHDAWSWGPGRQSLLRTTDGLAGDGTRWRAFQVVYVDPRDGRVRSFAMSPHAGGVARGELRFEGEVLEQRMEMHQTGGVRELDLRHVFDGPDRYRATLSEHHATSATVEMAVWDYERVAASESTLPAAQSNEPSRTRLRAFASYVGSSWRAPSAGDGSPSLRTELAWMPQVAALRARVYAEASSDARNGGTALLDAYVYELPLEASLRVLALAHDGDVYEGSAEAHENGRLELQFFGYEGQRVGTYLMDLARDASGKLRESVWRMNGAELQSLRERWHERQAPTQD